MFGQPIHFEWRYFDDDESWAAFARAAGLSSAAAAEPKAPSSRRISGELRLGLRLLCGLVVLLSGGVMATGAANMTAQQAQVGIQGALYALLSVEDEAKARGDQSQLAQLIDPQVGRNWQRAWSAVRLVPLEEEQPGGLRIVRLQKAGDLVQAEIIFNRPIMAGWQQFGPYRETRFYRQSAEGWLRTLPNAAFWGQARVLETNHLRFEYLQRDAATVTAIANQMEEVYLSLHEILELDPENSPQQPTLIRSVIGSSDAETPPDAKVTIELTLEQVNGRGSYGNRLEVTAPLMLQAPQDLSAVEFLTHTIISRLTGMVMNNLGTPDDYLAEATFAYSWGSMRRGVRSWLRTELIGNPYYWDAQADAIFRRHSASQLPLKLADLTEINEARLADREYLMWQSAAAASVVSYAVETYGRDSVPRMMHGFRHARSWQELIDQLFSLSHAEFESDWNRYLREKINHEQTN